MAKITVSIPLDTDTVDTLNELATAEYRTRASIARQALLIGLPILKEHIARRTAS